jgi:hypothetical protein
MTSADIIKSISETITIVKATTKDYNVVKEDTSLREAFHEAGRGLILVKETLQGVKDHLDICNPVGDPKKAMRALEACNETAKLSKVIFEDVAKAEETSRFENYKEAVRDKGKGRTVEAVVKGMMSSVCQLAQDSSIKGAMEDHVKGLRAAIEKLTKMEPSLPTEESAYIFSHYGDGDQFNALEGGTQNIARGSGPQFPGANFNGNLQFG